MQGLAHMYRIFHHHFYYENIDTGVAFCLRIMVSNDVTQLEGFYYNQIPPSSI